jgi:hypothetical protein
MIIAIIFPVIMSALAAYLAWTIWEAYGEARNERVKRARRRRVIQPSVSTFSETVCLDKSMS